MPDEGVPVCRSIEDSRGAEELIYNSLFSVSEFGLILVLSLVFFG